MLITIYLPITEANTPLSFHLFMQRMLVLSADSKILFTADLRVIEDVAKTGDEKVQKIKNSGHILSSSVHSSTLFHIVVSDYSTHHDHLAVFEEDLDFLAKLLVEHGNIPEGDILNWFLDKQAAYFDFHGASHRLESVDDSRPDKRADS